MRLVSGLLAVIVLCGLSIWLLFEQLGPLLLERDAERTETAKLETTQKRLRNRHPEIPDLHERTQLAQELSDVERQLGEITDLEGTRIASAIAVDLANRSGTSWVQAYAEHKERMVGEFLSAATRRGARSPKGDLLIESVLPLYAWELEPGSQPADRERATLARRLALTERVLEAAGRAGLFGLESLSFLRPSGLRLDPGTGLEAVPMRLEALGTLDEYETFLTALLKDDARPLDALIEDQVFERSGKEGVFTGGAGAPIRLRLDLTVIARL